ncbi:MAG: hypothetical protein FWF91_05125 [Coriobacteriia bacterium]|nr:hypothetical protein [Coriobacteriia bacterium]
MKSSSPLVPSAGKNAALVVLVAILVFVVLCVFSACSEAKPRKDLSTSSDSLSQDSKKDIEEPHGSDQAIDTDTAVIVALEELGSGWEVVVNSGMAVTLVLEENIVAGGFDLAQAVEANGAIITDYYGKEIEFKSYAFFDSGGQGSATSFAFVYHEDRLLAYQNIGSEENALALMRYCSELSEGS